MPRSEHNVLATIYHAIKDNIPGISLDEFIKLSLDAPEHQGSTIAIPILFTTQLSDADVEFIRKELPEVYEFMQNDKKTKECLRCSCDIDKNSNRAPTTVAKVVAKAVTTFYDNNHEYLRDIIIACIIEELILGRYPIVKEDVIQRIKYAPVQDFHTALAVEGDGSAMFFGFESLSELLDIVAAKLYIDSTSSVWPILDVVASKSYADPVMLAASRIFRYHQKVIAGILWNSCQNR